MYGSFNESAQEVWDFVRCQRPNGTFYGTRGKCRSGTEVGAKEIAAASPKTKNAKKALKKATVEQLQSLMKNPKLTDAQRAVVEQEVAKKKKKVGGPAVKESTQKTIQEPVKKQVKEPAPQKSEAPKVEKKTEKEPSLKELQAQFKILDEETKKKYREHDEALDERDRLNPRSKEYEKADAEYRKKLKDLTETGDRRSEIELRLALRDPKYNDEQKQALQTTLDRLMDRRKRDGSYSEGQLSAGLNRVQKTALKDYTNEGGERSYSILNACLRQPKECDKENKSWTSKHAREIDSALKSLPANEKGETFWRGVSVDNPHARAMYDFLSTAQPGTTIADPAFGSYTFDRNVVSNFTSVGRNIIFVSRSKQLRPINEFSEIRSEAEALLPRGTTQTVRSVTKDGNQLIVELD